MGKTIQQINPAIDDFMTWLASTNAMANAFLKTVTVASNSSGDLTSGNGFVTGTLGATSLVANSIGGGSIGSPGLLTFTTNSAFSSAFVNVVANVSISGANVSLTSNSLSIYSNSTVLAIGVTNDGSKTTTIIGGADLSVTANVVVGGKSFVVPVGNTAGRPSTANGSLRFNSDLGALEVVSGNVWIPIVAGNSALSAAGISFANNSNVTSNTVQAAILEVFNDKVSKGGDTATGALIINLNGQPLTSTEGYVLSGGSADSANTRVSIESYGATSSFTGKRADGTAASPSRVAAGEVLAALEGRGYSNGAGFMESKKSAVELRALESWVNTALGTSMVFVGARPGTNVAVDVFQASGNVSFVNSASFAVTGSMAVTNSATFANTVAVTGAATLSNTVAATGAVTAANTLAVTGNVTFSNTLSVVGAATLSANLAVSGALVVNGNTTANVASFAGNVTFSSAVHASGKSYGDIKSLTDGATVTPDFSNTNIFSLILTGTGHAIAAPTNTTAGQDIMIIVSQDATGGWVPTVNAVYKFPGGTDPTFSTAALSVDIIAGFVVNSTFIACSFLKGFA